MSRGVVVIGQPGDKRALAFDHALTVAGRGAPQRLSWNAVLDDATCLETAGKRGDWLRTESPGSDVTVWHRLARLGGLGDDVVFEGGEWRPGRAWATGLARALGAIDEASTHLVATHPSEEVLAMTDKWVCADRLARAGVPAPRLLPRVSSVGAFRSMLTDAKVSAVFVKPRWGSSGAGVLAYRRAPGREQLTTTARLCDGRVWNHKELSTYTDAERIRVLLDLVLGDGAIVQQWAPKSGTKDGPFDLRVLVVRGRVEQRVARVGRGPITNLHLGAARLDVDAALAPFGASCWTAVEDVCVAAAACFPRAQAVAVDVMVTLAGAPLVLECNAWGDYLPGLLSNGQDTYQVQIRELLAS